MPESFDGIRTKDFVSLAEIVFSCQEDHRKKMFATIAFLKWRAYFFKDYQLVEFTNTVEWIFGSDNSCERTIIRVVKNKFDKRYGPKNVLHEIPWGVFRNVSDYLSLFEHKKEEQYLDKACALLYAGKDFEKDVVFFSKVKKGVKLAIYWNWCLMLAAIYPMFPLLFKKSTKKKTKPQLWYVLNEQMHDYNLPEIKKYDEFPCMEVLATMNLRVKGAKENNKKK